MTVVDQAVSGASNVLALLLAVQTLSAPDFGAFSLVFLLYGFVTVLSRSLIGRPIMAHPDEAETHLREVIGAAGAIGLTGGGLALICAVPLSLTAVESRSTIVLLGLFLPLLVVQDTCRFVAIARLEPARAVAIDLLWLVGMVGGAVAMTLADVSGLTMFFLVWGASGALSGLVALMWWRVWIPANGLPWIAATWPMSWRFAMTTIPGQFAAFAVAAVLVPILGPAAIGALVAAQLFARPYTMAEVSVVGASVVEIARANGAVQRIEEQVRRTVVVAGAIALTNSTVVLLLPDVVGEQVLGATWPQARLLLVPLAVQMLVKSIATGPRAALVGSGGIQATVWIAVVMAPSLMTLSTVGGVLYGIRGAVWAGVLTWAGGSVATVLAYRRHMILLGHLQAANGAPEAPVAAPDRGVR